MRLFAVSYFPCLTRLAIRFLGGIPPRAASNAVIENCELAAEI